MNRHAISQNVSSDALEGIKRISVQGFKSIREQQGMDIRPLTILAGVNSSGKSSMMQPLLLMKQTEESSFDPGTFLLDGPNVKFSSVDEFFSNEEQRMALEFEILKSWIEPDPIIVSVGYEKSTSNPIGVDVASTSTKCGDRNYELFRGTPFVLSKRCFLFVKRDYENSVGPPKSDLKEMGKFHDGAAWAAGGFDRGNFACTRPSRKSGATVQENSSRPRFSGNFCAVSCQYY
jgi:hypothetical protein